MTARDNRRRKARAWRRMRAWARRTADARFQKAMAKIFTDPVPGPYEIFVSPLYPTRAEWKRARMKARHRRMVEREGWRRLMG